MNHDVQAHLTAAGERRREAILEELVGRLHARRRRRRIVRHGVAVIVLVAAVAAAFRLTRPGTTAPPQGGLAHHGEGGPGAQEAAGGVEIVLVRTDPSIVDRCRVEPAREAELIGDEELIRTLEALGRPAGIVRSGGRAWLAETLPPPDRKSDAS
jgi:hypothetical protein